MKRPHFIHRMNQQSPPVRQAVDTGHSPYERGPVSGPSDPRWQLKPTPVAGPEVDMMVLQAHLAAAQWALEAAEQEVMDAIELDPAILTPPRKRRPIGKAGCPPEAL